MSSVKISVKNATYVYGAGTPYEVKALDNVSVDVHAGRITGIIGHTGSGKSTLVQLFNGLLKPTSGSVLLDGRDIWNEPKKISEIRYRVGLVMQYPEYQLFEETVEKDIAYAPTNMGLEPAEIKERVMEAVVFAGVEKDWLEKSPFDLSGGQKRRVALAGILAMRPEVLVLDEPAAGLDPRGKKMILGGIREYQRKTGSTVVIVSHSMEDMANYCDELVVMAGAGKTMQGSAEEVFSHSRELSEIGLDIPQITKLMEIIKNSGVDVNSGVYTVDAAYREIIKLFQK